MAGRRTVVAKRTGSRIVYRLMTNWLFWVLIVFGMVGISIVSFRWFTSSPIGISRSTAENSVANRPQGVARTPNERINGGRNLLKAAADAGNEAARQALQEEGELKPASMLFQTMPITQAGSYNTDNNGIVFSTNINRWQDRTTAMVLGSLIHRGYLLRVKRMQDCFAVESGVMDMTVSLWSYWYPDGKETVEDDYDFHFNHFQKAQRAGLLSEEILMSICPMQVPRSSN